MSNEAFIIVNKLYKFGRCLIPSGGGTNGKRALVPWKPYQSARPTLKETEENEAD